MTTGDGKAFSDRSLVSIRDAPRPSTLNVSRVMLRLFWSDLFF